MKASLFNRHGIEITSKTFPVGTDLMTAALVLFSSCRVTCGTVPCSQGQDYLGTFVRCSDYKTREVK